MNAEEIKARVISIRRGIILQLLDNDIIKTYISNAGLNAIKKIEQMLFIFSNSVNEYKNIKTLNKRIIMVLSRYDNLNKKINSKKYLRQKINYNRRIKRFTNLYNTNIIILKNEFILDNNINLLSNICSYLIYIDILNLQKVNKFLYKNAPLYLTNLSIDFLRYDNKKLNFTNINRFLYRCKNIKTINLYRSEKRFYKHLTKNIKLKVCNDYLFVFEIIKNLQNNNILYLENLIINNCFNYIVENNSILLLLNAISNNKTYNNCGTKLKSLELKSLLLNDYDFNYIFKFIAIHNDCFKYVQYLDLSNNFIGERTITYITSILQVFININQINLSNNIIDNNSLIILLKSKFNKQIEFNLTNNFIDDALLSKLINNKYILVKKE